MSPRYEVEGVVGRGATGVVYRARQCDTGNRIVAYKRIAGYDPAAVDRLRAEVELLSAFDHPNIVRIFDVVAEERAFAVVMQFAAGGSLSDRLAAGPLSVPEVATVLIAIAEALASAHARGVVHGDIKPANILFTADGHPLLSDFGAARHVAGGVAGPLTTTLEYLDPAVAAGTVYDERSDVYALAVVGYEMLCGQRPPAAVGTDEAAPDRLGQGRHDALTGIIVGALGAEPQQRPTAAGLAASLRTAVAAAPPSITPASPVVHAPDRREPPTRTFGPRPPARAPLTPERVVPWRRVAASAVALALVPPLVVVGMGRSSSSARTPVAPAVGAVIPNRPLPPCADAPDAPAASADVQHGDLLGRDCSSWVRYRRGILEVALPATPEVTRFRLGSDTDQVVVGDWDCDGDDTVALYQTRTGKVFEFSTWPRPDRPLRSTSGYDTRILGGIASVTSSRGADHSSCDEVTVTAG